MLNTIRKLFCFSVLMLTIASGVAHGDGKFFYIEKVPVGVPYQRGLLIYEDGKETLILQSKYETVSVEDGNSIAWVVPVPAVPELASMDAKEANFMFFWFGFRSQPNVFPLGRLSIIVIILALISFLIGIVLNWFFAKLIKTEVNTLIVSGLRIAVGVIVGFFLILVILMPSLGTKGVDVLKAETVGIYDVKVMRGDDAGAVTQWLKDNGFGFGETDTKVFDQYVKKGWCFVTAKVDKDVNLRTEGAVSEGLAAPLIMRFDSNDVIYPLALTGTTSVDTEILLYILSDHKVECGERLRLAFFGETSSPFGEIVSSEFFHNVKTKSWQMCKFKGTLKPEQMKDDIVFKQAKDDEPYRENRWY